MYEIIEITIKGKNIDNTTLSKILTMCCDNVKTVVDEIEYEKPQDPSTVILTTLFVANGNLQIAREAHRNITWLVQIPNRKNYSKEFNKQQVSKALIEKYGDRISDLEVVAIHLENYQPIEIPDSLFMNTTLEQDLTHKATVTSEVNTDNYSYRNCPVCGGFGRPTPLVNMYRCAHCGMIYYGYKDNESELPKRHNKMKLKLSIKFEPRDIWVGCYWKKCIRHDSFDTGYTVLVLFICLIPLFPIIISIPLKVIDRTQYDYQTTV